MLGWYTLHMISFIIILLVFFIPIIAIIVFVAMIVRHIKNNNKGSR